MRNVADALRITLDATCKNISDGRRTVQLQIDAHNNIWQHMKVDSTVGTTT